MKEQIENAKKWIIDQDVEGCLTGSSLLDYYEGQDVDIFCYNEAAFTKMIYSMYFSKLFLLIEPIEKWKFKEYTEKNSSSLKKFGMISIKFKYNMSVDVNVIFKKTANNIFAVLSSFDMNIIARGIDLKTKEMLDLSGGVSKDATWNKWNTAFYSVNLWETGRLLRQFQRCIKYYKRGYNTDLVVLKYKELLLGLLEYENIFKSERMDNKVSEMKKSGEILLKIFNTWLETHYLSEEDEKKLEETINSLY